MMVVAKKFLFSRVSIWTIFTARLGLSETENNNIEREIVNKRPVQKWSLLNHKGATYLKIQTTMITSADSWNKNCRLAVSAAAAAGDKMKSSSAGDDARS